MFKDPMGKDELVFVPYRGTKFLSGEGRVKKALRKVFVPYRGTKFLSIKVDLTVKTADGFRPLPGN